MSGRGNRAERQSRRRIDADVRMYKWHTIGGVLSKLGGELIKWGALVFIVKFGISDPIKSLAGTSTSANIKVTGIGDFINQLVAGSSFSTIVLAVVAIGGIFGWRREARLRRDVIERHHPEQKSMEEKIDPRRSSSGLTQRGETRQEDL